MICSKLDFRIKNSNKIRPKHTLIHPNSQTAQFPFSCQRNSFVSPESFGPNTYISSVLNSNKDSSQQALPHPLKQIAKGSTLFRPRYSFGSAFRGSHNSTVLNPQKVGQKQAMPQPQNWSLHGQDLNHGTV